MEIEDSDGNRAGFTGIWIPAEVIRQDLTATELLLYGMVASFPKGCYLTAEDIEKRIKCKAATRRKAVQHLEELGFISTTKQSNGRILIRTTLGFQKPQNASERTKDEKAQKHPTETAKAQETAKTSLKTPKEAQAQATKRNEDIDWAFAEWERTLGIPQVSNQKKNRYACHNLLRKEVTAGLPKGRETVGNLIKLVRESKKDRFAPRIADFAELQSKLDALLDWATRKREQQIKAGPLLDLRQLKKETESCKTPKQIEGPTLISTPSGVITRSK